MIHKSKQLKLTKTVIEDKWRVRIKLYYYFKETHVLNTTPPSGSSNYDGDQGKKGDNEP